MWPVTPFSTGYWSGRPTEDRKFGQVHAEGADWTDSYRVNDRFTERLAGARAELDTAKPREMYVEMQRIVHDDCGTIIPMFMSNTAAATSRVGLPDQIAANREPDGLKNTERWRFES